MPSKPHRPMSDQAVARWHAFFCDWRSPKVAGQALEILSNLAGDHVLDDQRLKWAKEAHLAWRYGKALCSKAIRIVEDDPPDFEALSEAGLVGRCEAVEVVRPGRLRDQELRQDRLKPARATHDPEEIWPTVAEAVDAVDAQIAKKADKKYRERFVLVVYVNIGFLRGDQAAFRRALLERQTAGHPNFSALHFL